jgi:multicomponent Na+:H+ antiporter subunit D
MSGSWPLVPLPGMALVAGGLLLPLVPRGLRASVMLVLPVLGLLQLVALPAGASLSLDALGLTLELVRVDGLSLVFGYVFHLAAFLGVIFSLRVRDLGQQVAALVYAGSAIGAVFAGDLLTLFLYWELTAVSSVFLIWAARDEGAFRAGLRYLVVQILSGMLLLVGLALHHQATDSLAFGHLGLESPGGVLIFLAFGIKCAFPLLHTWLTDTYPRATVTGAVFLSAFTTKLAVYALARGFAGTEVLIWIGALMAVLPVFYAVIEDDLRRVLSYSLIIQLGFMVVGVGVGTELALNGTAAHAFGHVLYKALLFMAMGAVLHQTGTARASELGGLYRSMPITAWFCMVGAASISAVPLFSGFVSKAFITSATAQAGHHLAWTMLLFASAGALLYVGIKVPYFAFFGRDSGVRVAEAPRSMLVAMGLGAAMSVVMGVRPQFLYPILPFPTVYNPYTLGHVLGQLQLLLFSALIFVILFRRGWYPRMVPCINLDFDWIWRGGVPRAWRFLARIGGPAWHRAGNALGTMQRQGLDLLQRHFGHRSRLARVWPTGSMVLWVVVLLALSLLVSYF